MTCALMLACMAARAGRPFVADDPRIVDARACQLETYYAHAPDARQYGAVPACNPTGNLEISLGATRSLDDDTSTHAVAQLKTVLRPVPTGGWGVGLAIGADHGLSGADKGLRNVYLNVPFTVWVYEDRVQWLVNAGVTRDRPQRRTDATYATAIDAALGSRLALVAEIFGAGRERASWQAGARVTVIPARVEMAGAVSAQFGSADRLYTIVLRLFTPPL